MDDITPLKPQLRQAVWLFWLPLAVITLSFSIFSLSATNSNLPIFQSGNLNGNMFAAAPPRGQVLGDYVVGNADTRAKILQSYLKAYKSPLADHAGTFITVADKYDLDWRLLPAIAGVESGFGNAMPKNSYNAWGWGVPTGAQSGVSFESWDDAIETVGKGLRNSYVDQGYDTLLAIESRYTPPSASQSDHPWVTGVEKFMAEIE
jgi:hypothetical protein